VRVAGKNIRVLTVADVATVVAQEPACVFVDVVRWKRGLHVTGALAMASSAVVMALVPQF
jgi:hypothetical protein